MDRTRDARGVSFERRLAPAASLGPLGDLLVGAPPHPAQTRPVDPILLEDDIRIRTGRRREGWAARARSVLFPIDEGVAASRHALGVLRAWNIPGADSLP